MESTSRTHRHLPFVSAGISSMVFAQSESTVIKRPCGSDNSFKALAIELTIYKRLGLHPYITGFISADGDSIILERYQYQLRLQLWQLQNDGQTPPSQDVLLWAYQVAQALQHVHSHNVRQVDIGTHNILLDPNNNARLSDFAGSSIDRSKPLVSDSNHSMHPDIPVLSVQAEVFVFGSTLFEIETTRKPHHDRGWNEVQDLFRAQKFPDTASLLLGPVIRNCWHVEYQSMDEVDDDLKRIQRE